MKIGRKTCLTLLQETAALMRAWKAVAPFSQVLCTGKLSGILEALEGWTVISLRRTV